MDKAQKQDPKGIVVKDIYKSSGPKARELAHATPADPTKSKKRFPPQIVPH
jgi:hypothetical protein